jgi:hypothetical protein
MNKINKEYLIVELLELIAHEQLSGRVFPEMPGERIEAIADSILWEWNEIKDPESSIQEIIKNNLEDNISFA